MIADSARGRLAMPHLVNRCCNGGDGLSARVAVGPELGKRKTKRDQAPRQILHGRVYNKCPRSREPSRRDIVTLGYPVEDAAMYDGFVELSVFGIAVLFVLVVVAVA